MLFLHWAVAPDQVQETLPEGLTVDLHEGKAFLGIIPFFITGNRLPFLPPLPGFSAFQEINVRTYVKDRQGRPGVWFYSLDANDLLAVVGARLLYGLPYLRAKMDSLHTSRSICYRSRRGKAGARWSSFTYPASRSLSLAPTVAGSLEFFLMERYRLFALRGRQLISGTVSHPPYRVAECPVEFVLAKELLPDGFNPGAKKPVSVLVSDGPEVEIHPPEIVP